MYIEDDHIREWARGHGAVIAPVEASRAFAGYLDSLPWKNIGLSLDWSGTPHYDIAWSDYSDEELASVARTTAIGRHAHMFVFYGRTEPGLYCGFESGIRDIDTLYWKAPGARYFCGADAVGESVTAAHSALVEFNGTSKLTFAR